MSKNELRQEISNGVNFWGYEENGKLVGVMGIQDVIDFSLIRHAYVLESKQNQGIGTKLVAHLRTQTARPMLVGTWTTATWAIHFYEKQGFKQVTTETKDRLLRTYWSIPERQVETSTVLADKKWLDQ